jgi:hypothetical protein
LLKKVALAGLIVVSSGVVTGEVLYGFDGKLVIVEVSFA